MIKGTVKWFNAQKGYGFIICEDGTEAFLHYSDIAMNGFKVVTEGQNVEFEIAQTAKGPQAINVVVV